MSCKQRGNTAAGPTVQAEDDGSQEAMRLHAISHSALQSISILNNSQFILELIFEITSTKQQCLQTVLYKWLDSHSYSIMARLEPCDASAFS